jgi:glycosyltransferase involved in cell wall biosynthesis
MNTNSTTSLKTPVLSVITVVYNNVRDIERTVKSVLQQTHPAIEYIVIDGGSTDGTLEVLKRYEDQLSQLHSEPDKGIYDAMNKGLKLATGDYVLFINSGDEIYAPDTVAKVFASAEDADIYYGETELYNEDWQPIGMRRLRTPEKFDWTGFKRGMTISHQAIYVKRSIAPLYDLNYKLSADIDWVIRAAKQARCIQNTHLIVAKYLAGGLSQKRHKESLKERFAILSKHYGLISNLWNHSLITFRYIFYRLLRGKPQD